MTVGESVRPYQDIFTVVLGDPNVSLPKTRPQFDSNMIFDQQIGRYLGRMDSDIAKVLPLENYIIFAETEGAISIFTNNANVLIKKLPKFLEASKTFTYSKMDPSQLCLFLQTTSVL